MAEASLQTYSDGENIYSVDMMFLYLNYHSFPLDMVAVSEYIQQLNRSSWGDPKSASLYSYSPMDVIHNPDQYPSDYSRIQNANLSYAIIVSENGDIIDGLHRLAKAFLEKQEKIKVYIFPMKLLEKFIIAKVSDTAWETIDQMTIHDITELYRQRFPQKSSATDALPSPPEHKRTKFEVQFPFFNQLSNDLVELMLIVGVCTNQMDVWDVTAFIHSGKRFYDAFYNSTKLWKFFYVWMVDEIGGNEVETLDIGGVVKTRADFMQELIAIQKKIDAIMVAKVADRVKRQKLAKYEAKAKPLGQMITALSDLATSNRAMLEFSHFTADLQELATSPSFPNLLQHLVGIPSSEISYRWLVYALLLEQYAGSQYAGQANVPMAMLAYNPNGERVMRPDIVTRRLRPSFTVKFEYEEDDNADILPVATINCTNHEAVFEKQMAKMFRNHGYTGVYLTYISGKLPWFVFAVNMHGKNKVLQLSENIYSIDAEIQGTMKVEQNTFVTIIYAMLSLDWSVYFPPTGYGKEGAPKIHRFLKCQVCDSTEKQLLVCGNCAKPSFCSSLCQEKGWHEHVKNCK